MSLSESRKSDRAVLASQVAELTMKYGELQATVICREDRRLTQVALAGPHGLGLTVDFDGNNPNPPDTYVLSWYGVEQGWRLRTGKFGNVNQFHGHKATDVVHGTGELLTLLERRFASIADGSAFDISPPRR